MVAHVLPTNLTGGSHSGRPSSLRIQVPDDIRLGVRESSSNHLQTGECAGASYSVQDSLGEERTGVENLVVPDSDDANESQAIEPAGVIDSATTENITRQHIPAAGVANWAVQRRHTIPPQAGPPATDEKLTRTGEDLTLGDKGLLIRVTGQQPTSLRLHTIRDALGCAHPTRSEGG